MVPWPLLDHEGIIIPCSNRSELLQCIYDTVSTDPASQPAIELDCIVLDGVGFVYQLMMTCLNKESANTISIRVVCDIYES